MCQAEWKTDSWNVNAVTSWYLWGTVQAKDIPTKRVEYVHQVHTVLAGLLVTPPFAWIQYLVMGKFKLCFLELSGKIFFKYSRPQTVRYVDAEVADTKGQLCDVRGGIAPVWADIQHTAHPQEVPLLPRGACSDPMSRFQSACGLLRFEPSECHVQEQKQQNTPSSYAGHNRLSHANYRSWAN